MDERPNPDQLLQSLAVEDDQSSRGRLKLFFGASPGVGKTYAMLEAARQRKKEGQDVVVGLVETHRRPETEALLNGLDVLPRREVSYKGVVLKEFDLDAALARRPRLILVDELAHTNAEGMRHRKRWQDIAELLAAGIDVYTTLNVQHWESLNDVVAKITGVAIRETVPDTFLNYAHDIELVDLAPEDLLQRLHDGKVYRGDVVGRAAENFFKPANLIALRELALRHAAERIDAQMQSMKERLAIGSESWVGGERLLVGVTASPMSARLIRATTRLAVRLKAPWIAVHIETPTFLSLPPEERARVTEHLRLAGTLGAEVITLTGTEVSREMIRLARQRSVTRIILGKPAQPRWKEWLLGSVVNQMARQCGSIDLHIISGVGGTLAQRRGPVDANPQPWSGFAWGLVAVATCTLFCWPLSHAFDRVNLAMIYLVGVVWTSYRFDRRVAFFVSVLSVIAFDFFYVPPYLTFAVSDAQYFLTFGILLAVGLFISTLTSRLHHQTDSLRQREERMRALYRLSRDLSETPDPKLMIQAAHRQLEDFYKVPMLFLEANAQRSLNVSAGDPQAFGWNDNELSVAQWAVEHGQIAGAGSDTLSGASALYIPLKGRHSTVGVLGIKPAQDKPLVSPESLQLLEAFASEIGGAVESTRMSEEIGRRESQIEMQALSPPGLPAFVRISDYLTENQILVLPSVTSDARVIRELTARLVLPNRAAAVEAIFNREKSGTLSIQPEVRLPHARLAGLDSLKVAVAVCPEGPVRVWILFLSPLENTRLHLAFLASLSHLFQNPHYAVELGRQETPADVMRAIRGAEQIKHPAHC